MKRTKHIAGRLSLGSFLETVTVVALTGGAILLVAEVIAGAEFSEAALTFLFGVLSFALLGLVSFPVYCWAMKNRRLMPLTIVEEEPEPQEIANKAPEDTSLRADPQR